jgi:acetyl esterase/lipase
MSENPFTHDAAGRLVLPLWPASANGAHPNQPVETEIIEQDHLVAGKAMVCLADVSKPTLTVYPPLGENTGAAVVVFPGGGYRVLAWDIEGTEACEWLSSLGITCLLLKYSVPGSGPYPKSFVALCDAQRAMSVVRARAAEWKIDPGRLGVLGFSAGAYLGALVGTSSVQRFYAPLDLADKQSSRPDFSILIYPGYFAFSEKGMVLNSAIKPTKETPSTFLVQTGDDPVGVENAMLYYMALREKKVSAELHLYALGGHAYGLRATGLPVASWPQSAEAWMRSMKILPSERASLPTS